MERWSSDEQRAWYGTLPRFYGGACGYLTDAADRALLVKPNYRDYWLMPGGVLEEDEYPHEGCAREIKEELGLTVAVSELLAVEWAPSEEPRPHATVNFIFDGGVISDPSQIRLQEEELDDYAFVAVSEVPRFLPPHAAPRIPAAAAARRDGRTRYLCAG